MEEYLEKLLAQIRCKKARPYIAEEIRGHIESQIEDNIVSGMTDQEAEKMRLQIWETRLRLVFRWIKFISPRSHGDYLSSWEC